MKKRILKKQKIYTKKIIFKSIKNIKENKKTKNYINPKINKLCIICGLILVYIFSYINKSSKKIFL